MYPRTPTSNNNKNIIHIKLNFPLPFYYNLFLVYYICKIIVIMSVPSGIFWQRTQTDIITYQIIWAMGILPKVETQDISFRFNISEEIFVTACREWQLMNNKSALIEQWTEHIETSGGTEAPFISPLIEIPISWEMSLCFCSRARLVAHGGL